VRSRLRRLLPLVVLAVVASACGSSGSSSPDVPTFAPAKTFKLIDLEPAGAVTAKRPVELSFRIQLPSGETLTRFKTGAGPHTGVHLIIVRDDLSQIVHRHPQVAADGTVRQSITFPAPGRYHVLVDVYPVIPATPQLVNFQLTATTTVSGAEQRVPLPAYAPEVKVGGYRVQIEKKPTITELEPAFVTMRIRGADGRSPHLQPYYGALAHAIFFRVGSLAYFHTHICAPGAPGCGSLVGGPALKGTGTASGNLHVGILLPQSGTWRLFLQFKVKGRILTAPFTLQVR
jgi:hypothetical protein